MLNVLRKYPTHIRSLILDSPLPLYVNIDEDELANFNEVLHQIFVNETQEDIEDRFNKYLITIEKKIFSTDYYDENQKKNLKINYGRNELIDIIGSKVGDEDDRKTITKIVSDFINGNHKSYIKNYLDDVFKDNSTYSGMRLSVYCSDKMAYTNQNIAKQQIAIYPQMAGYKANDVTYDMCKCWKVPALKAEHKSPFYANTPMLLGAGYFDPATRPIYNDILHHYFPKSQRLLFMKKAHGPLISLEGNSLIAAFLNNPFKKLAIANNEIKSY
jgi:TAP-like protein